MPAGHTFSCQGCGRHWFPEPRLCYWCQHPMEETTRAAKVADGILRVMGGAKAQVPMDKWEAERLRMRSRRRGYAKVQAKPMSD